MRKPAVQDEIGRLVDEGINALSVSALAVAKKILTDDTASIAVRSRLALGVLDRAGHAPPKAAEAPSNDRKPMSEMSIEELEAIVRKGKERLVATEGAEPGPEGDDNPSGPGGPESYLKVVEGHK